MFACIHSSRRVYTFWHSRCEIILLALRKPWFEEETETRGKSLLPVDRNDEEKANARKFCDASRIVCCRSFSVFNARRLLFVRRNLETAESPRVRAYETNISRATRVSFPRFSSRIYRNNRAHSSFYHRRNVKKKRKSTCATSE